MSSEVILFILRIAAGITLLLILLILFLVIWRDYRNTATQVNALRRVHGQLIGLLKMDESYIPTGQSYELHPLTTLGRSPTNSVTINDNFASSEHAMIALRNGQWWLEDRNSRNGTLLNDEPITTSTIVTDGDMVGIGNIYFRIEFKK